MNKLKLKVLLVIFSVIFISFGLFFYIFYKFQYDRLSSVQEQNYNRVHNSFTKNQELHLKERYIQESHKFLSNDMIDAFANQDRDTLIKLTKSLFDNLKGSDEYLELIHFHLYDGTSFLRLHMLDSWGDEIAKQRVMVADIHTKKEFISGFEYGFQGMSYRLFIPIFKENKYLGAFEIGVSPKKILDHVSYFNNLQGLIRLYGGTKEFQYENINNMALKNFIPQAKVPSNTQIKVDGKYLAMYSFDVASYDGKTIGDFIFFNDLTKYHIDFNEAIEDMFLIFLFSVLSFYLVFHYIFNLYSKQIQNLYEKTKTILDNQKNIIILTNGKELIDANKGFFDFVGYSNLENFKQDYRCICDLFIAENGYLSSKVDELNWSEFVLQNPNQKHLAKMVKNSQEHIFRVYAKSIETDGIKNEVVATFEDITQELLQRKEIKEKDILLQQQSRLAALGEMIGNIAHQWRQPLSAITSSASGLEVKREFGVLEEKDIQESTAFIVKNANFLSLTIENFRNFFKKNDDNTNFNLALSLQNTVEIVSSSYKNSNIDLKLELDETVFYYGSENLFSQVVLNILSNAKDSLVQNNIENKKVMIKLNKTDDLIKIEIIDNGGGIPENIKEKIFDPYFTTKHQSQGTGLGLYMSLEIIENHFDGSFKVSNTNALGSLGACFSIEFYSNKGANHARK
jgi:signal transduction histidine kinase